MLLLAAGKSEYDCRDFLILKYLIEEADAGSFVKSLAQDSLFFISCLKLNFYQSRFY